MKGHKEDKAMNKKSKKNPKITTSIVTNIADKRFTDKLNTVNVIELVDGDVIGISSFPNHTNGNINAEILFHDVIKDNYEDELDEVIEVAIRESRYAKDNYEIIIAIAD